MIHPGKQNKYRRFTGRGPRAGRREQRQREAVARNEAWASLSPREQLLEIDRRLGKGVGARKQRARIAARMGRVA